MATIYCFSSTGNSLYAAKGLAERIGGTVLPMHGESQQCEDDVIGFVFPVYFWGLPRMVARFVRDLRITRPDAYLFAVLTSGGPGFGVLGQLARMLRTKGLRLRYGRKIISVSNYLPEFSPRDSDALRRKMDQSLTKIAGDLRHRKSHPAGPTTFVNRLAYRLYPGENSDQYISVASICTGCGTCEKVCPAQNIRLQDHRPSFLHHCEHCLACLHHCPVRALDWKGRTAGKNRYRNAGISVEELMAFSRRQ